MSTLADIYIHHLDPIIVSLNGPFAIRWYGLAYVAGFMLGYFVLMQLSKRQLYSIPPDKLGDFITLICLFGVIIGARLGEFFFYWLPEHGAAGLISDPLWVFRVWEGGMASHGGIIATLIVAIIYSLRNKYSIAGVCDGLAIVCPIGLCFGRIANFINGELYGRPCSPDNPLAMKFPQELLELPLQTQQEVVQHLEQVAGKPLSALRDMGGDPNIIETVMRMTRESEPFRQALGEHLTPRYPSQLFEAFGEGLVIFLVLIILRLVWKKAPHGIFSALFCLLYAAARIISECFKEPDAPTWGIITRGQYLSFAIAALGLVFLGIALRNLKKARQTPA